eukprot:Awhi_evm1s14202
MSYPCKNFHVGETVKVIYPFRTFSIGDIVEILDTQGNWAYIIDKGNSVSRVPIQNLASVIPPNDPVFDRKDLEFYLGNKNKGISQDEDQKIKLYLRPEIESELQSIAVYSEKCEIDRDSAVVSNSLVFIQRVMTNFRKNKAMQKLSLIALRWLIPIGIQNQEPDQLDIHLDLQRTVHCDKIFQEKQRNTMYLLRGIKRTCGG